MNKLQTNGCSGGVSWFWRRFFGKPPPFEGCCHAHDVAYRQGGYSYMRFKADTELMINVAKKAHPYWAIMMFVAVRLFGGFRWNKGKRG